MNSPAQNGPVRIPEIIAPGGTLFKARIAFAYGADAVYAGAEGFSMRPDGASLSTAELREIVTAAHDLGRRFYVAINTLMFDADLTRLSAWLEDTADIPFDAVIVSDPGALAMVREARPGIGIHISTQASAANSASVAFWARAGAKRVVLARECSLKQAAAIAHHSRIETEIFVHGAMCVAVSGRCILSAHLCGSSASKGKCKQSCRWEWQLVEAKRPGETFPIFETGRETLLMGSTDLCLIDHIPAIVQTGVSSLKIEGRMKSAHYVACVVRTYRAALDAYAAAPDTYETDPAWSEELCATSHRAYSTGFAFGYPKDHPGTLQTHNRPTGSYRILGIVMQALGAKLVTDVKNPFGVGDSVQWIAPGLAGGTTEVTSISSRDGEPQERAICGTFVHITVARNGGLPDFSILRRPATHERDV